MITKNVKLYLGDGFPVRIPVSQFDNMWQFVFTIVNNSQPWQIPTGATAVLNGKKPDGNVFAFSGTIENNTVTVDADVQMTAVAGQTVCELSILADGKTVGTANFILDVEEAPKSADDVVSDTVLDGYGMMVTNAVDDYIAQHPEVFGGDKFTQNAKNALLALLRKVAYIDENGQTYIDALESELFPPVSLVSIAAVFNQGSAVIYDTDSLDVLKQYLTVTASYDDGTTGEVTAYELSGTLTAGTSTITVSYGGKTATFTVAVTKYWDIEWDYTQGTPIGKGFAHSSDVVGFMTEEGYRLEGTSSGSCSLLTDPTTTADIGVSEITIKFNQIYPSMIGFNFDVKGIWAAIINANKLGYKITANNPAVWSASDVVQVQNIAISTGVEYTFKLEWNTASGARLWLNGEQMYSINSALTQANRTRWFLSVPSNCVVSVKSMRVKVVS